MSRCIFSSVHDNFSAICSLSFLSCCAASASFLHILSSCISCACCYSFSRCKSSFSSRICVTCALSYWFSSFTAPFWLVYSWFYCVSLRIFSSHSLSFSRYSYSRSGGVWVFRDLSSVSAVWTPSDSNSIIGFCGGVSKSSVWDAVNVTSWAH